MNTEYTCIICDKTDMLCAHMLCTICSDKLTYTCKRNGCVPYCSKCARKYRKLNKYLITTRTCRYIGCKIKLSIYDLYCCHFHKCHNGCSGNSNGVRCEYCLRYRCAHCNRPSLIIRNIEYTNCYYHQCIGGFEKCVNKKMQNGNMCELCEYKYNRVLCGNCKTNITLDERVHNLFNYCNKCRCTVIVNGSRCANYGIAHGKHKRHRICHVHRAIPESESYRNKVDRTIKNTRVLPTDLMDIVIKYLW